MSSRIVCLIVTAMLVFSAAATGQSENQPATSTGTPKVEIKTTKATYSDPSSGKAMYQAYCASCHGTDARGDGPAAPALKTAPPDLTMLTSSHKGEFPSAHVAQILRGDLANPAHGNKDMPVWGPVFRSLGHHSNSEVQLRIYNLTAYLQDVQKK